MNKPFTMEHAVALQLFNIVNNNTVLSDAVCYFLDHNPSLEHIGIDNQIRPVVKYFNYKLCNIKHEMLKADISGYECRRIQLQILRDELTSFLTIYNSLVTNIRCIT